MSNDSQLIRDGNTLILQGKVGFQNVNALYRAFKDEITPGITTIDCSRVDQCDSSAISLLLAGRSLAANHQIQLQIRGMNEQMLSLARLYEVELLI